MRPGRRQVESMNRNEIKKMIITDGRTGLLHRTELFFKITINLLE